MSRSLLRYGFTLVELLTVMAIIAILIGLVLAAISGVIKRASRDRAKTEIAAMGSALESYKADNGSYPAPPVGTGFSTTNDYVTSSPLLAGGSYQGSAAFLYEQLSGFTTPSYIYGSLTAPPSHVYYAFKQSQLGNAKMAAGGPVYVKDPFGASYGYYAGSVVTAGNSSVTNYPFNGGGQFDIWSTGSDPSSPPINIPTWVTDWSN